MAGEAVVAVALALPMNIIAARGGLPRRAGCTACGAHNARMMNASQPRARLSMHGTRVVDRAILRRRMRWASDPLLCSSIGQTLPDRQAELLLNWGLRQMARSVRQSVPLDDVQARAAIRSDLNLVRKIMRRLQQVLERRTSLDESLLVAHLAVVAALARQLPAAEGGTSRTRGTVRPDSLARVAQQAKSLDSQRCLLRLIRFAESSRRTQMN